MHQITSIQLNYKPSIIISMESIIAEPKIHLYEFMEIEILHEYIETGIEYMVKSILNSNDKFIHFRYFAQQIATLISGLKDIYFLIRHKGIYAENFYGLQRVNQRSKSNLLLEVLLWITLPYLFRKLQQKFNELKDKQVNGMNIGIVSKVYLKIFPILFCVVKVVSMVMKFRYLIVPSSKYYNLQYLFAKTELGYIQRQKPSPFPIMSFLKSPGLFLLLVAHKIAGYVFTSDKGRKQKPQATEVLPPIRAKKAKECPICGQSCKNPAVLKTSGYVFCYNCIIQQLRSDRKCPVTQLQTDETEVQIIYQ